MKLQENLFNIRKISYPNSDTRHGKIKIDLIVTSETACSCAHILQMVKECAQLMAHEKFLISYIKQYRAISPITPSLAPNLMVEIFLEQTEKEGTGIIYKMKALGSRLGKPEMKFFDISAELATIK